MKRLFAAVKITPAQPMMAVYQQLRNLLRNHRITWVEPHNIHLTLKFFGDTPEDAIPQINEAFGTISSRHQPFGIQIGSVGIFGSSYQPRVIWFGISNPEPMEKLAEDVLSTMNDLGFPRDEQHFRPHVTIGRIKQVNDRKQFQKIIDQFRDTELQSMAVHQFELMESRLTPAGPIYTVLKSFPLG